MAGVGAGTGAMSCLLGKLTTLLSDEYTLLKSVRKEIAFLERELRSMHALLETLADMHKLDPLGQDWKGSLRELSYDIEDCIDRFMDRLGNGDAERGFVKRTVLWLKTLWKRHDIAAEIQELKARVMEESKRRDRYELDGHRNPRKPVVEIDPRLDMFHDEARSLVAIDGPVNQVVAWLAEESTELKVVAIVGCAGLGKTTLAMQVYRKIGGNFQCRASVSVSRILDLERLLKDVLSQIRKDEFRKCQTERWGKEQIIRAISQILTEKRYLIVIDDVWREEDWKIIKASFPGNHNGSRIIATTRITNVARSCCSNSGGQLYEMAHLNSVDSERLLFKRIFGPDNGCPPHLKEISAKILKKCGGLPLAIITVASLLANKPPTKDEWERLQDSISIDSSQNDSLKAMRDILLLSYWDLPQHLKTCLLYLCIYPEDHCIECEELKWKWIAEGFIDKQWGNLDQEAENYLNELANRSMLQVVDTNYDSSIKYCQVHDMVLDLITSLSDEENFATVLNGRVCNSLPSKIRRLSMHSNGQQHEVAIHATARSKLHARSLHVFGKFKQITPLVNFLSLRVLDIREGYYSSNSCCFWLEKKQIQNIGSLSQLRYLRLDSSKITELPEEVGMLRYLETLDLRHCNSLTVLPSTMARLQKLVHLLVHERLILHSDTFGRMHALEVVSAISYVDNPMKFAEELGNLTNLRKIYMPCSVAFLQAKNGDYVEAFVETLVSSLNELGKYNLKYLHISGSVGENMFSDTCAFPHLQDLEICTLIEGVPKGMASLNNMVRLLIKVRLFDEEDLQLLMGMPSLTHLELTLYHRIGVRKKHSIGSNGFKLLKVLHYEIALSPGTGISFAPGALPALRWLHLSWTARDVMSRHCDGADLGIEHLSGLAQLHVETNCRCATVGEVEAVEASIEKAIALHPNRRNLQAHVRRECAHEIYEDDKERNMESDEDTADDSDEEYGNSEIDNMGDSPPPSTSRLLQEDQVTWRGKRLSNPLGDRLFVKKLKLWAPRSEGHEHCSVPLWEREFCSYVGNVSWHRFCENKQYVSVYNNLEQWDDSGAFENFQNSKARFWANYHGQPSGIPLPDPDMYIDKVDHLCKVDPELVADLDKVRLPFDSDYSSTLATGSDNAGADNKCTQNRSGNWDIYIEKPAEVNKWDWDANAIWGGKDESSSKWGNSNSGWGASLEEPSWRGWSNNQYASKNRNNTLYGGSNNSRYREEDPSHASGRKRNHGGYFQQRNNKQRNQDEGHHQRSSWQDHRGRNRE